MTAPSPDPSDPDAADLPPGAVLPERRAFRRGQLRALALTNLAVFMILLLWWWLTLGSRESRIILACAAVVGLLFLFNLTRWLLCPKPASP